MKAKRLLSLLVAMTMVFSLFGAFTFTTEAASMNEADFFAKLNYNAFPELRGVKSAVDRGDYAEAKKALLEYYRERTINGTVKAFDITEADANIGQAMLAKDFIITGPYEFDVWLDTVTVNSNTYQPYYAEGDEIVKYLKKEIDNKNMSIMLFERQKQGVPVFVASREDEANSPELIVTFEDGTEEAIGPDRDTYIHSGNQDKNFGGEEVLEIKEQSDSVSDAFGTQTRRAYINFPLESLAGKNIKSAKIKLTARYNDDGTTPLDIHILSVGNTLWEENSWTWSSTNGLGNTYSWQNSADGPWWTSPAGCDSEYLNVALRYWYARPMVWEYLKYLEAPEEYPEGEEFGEKLVVLMDALTKKYDQTTQNADRTIEFGERNNRWVDVLYNLLPTPLFDPAENPDAPEQFFNIINYMYGDMKFTRGRSDVGWSNWGAVFLSGMQKAYEFFPEFTEVPEWKAYNENRLMAKFDKLYNNDMSFTESGPAYAIWCAELFGDAYRMAVLNGNDLGSEYKTMLTYATRFAMECAYPNGYDTNIGDSNYRPRMDKFKVLAAALDDPHITNYVNGGADNTGEYLTRFYDDANSAYMRNSWDPAEAVYINYTNNPSVGHAHPDLNQVIMYAYGQPLLVDSGRVGYSGSAQYNEVRKAEAHNTVSVDGIEYNSDFHSNAKAFSYTVANGDFDFAEASHSNFASNSINQTRDVLFLHDGYAIVSDYVTGAASKTYNQNWHFLPSSNATVNDGAISTAFAGRANISMASAGAAASVKKGVHSADYGLATVSEFGAFAKTGKDVKFNTLLYPTRPGEEASVAAEDLAPDDASKGAVKFTIDGSEVYYYVKNTASADGTFGDYTTDAKLAYVGDNTLVMVDGTKVEGGNIQITGTETIDDIYITLNDGVLEISGSNLAENTSKDTTAKISAHGVTSVKLNGKDITFTQDGDDIYAVSVDTVTRIETREIPADKDGFVKNGDENEGKTSRDVIQADLSSWAARNAYVAFNLGDITENNLKKAVIKMVPTELARTPGKVDFYFLDYGEWTRDELKFVEDTNKMPTNNSTSGAGFTDFRWRFDGNVGGLSEGDVFEVDFTDSLKGHLSEGGDAKFTLAILSEGGSIQFASLTNGTYPGPTIVLSKEMTEGEATPTTVTVNFVDGEGNVLKPAETVTSGLTDGKVYIYTEAPEALEYEGKHYTLNTEKSFLGAYINKGKNHVLNAVYTEAAKVDISFTCDGEEVGGEEVYVAPGTTYTFAPDALYFFDGKAYMTDEEYSSLSVKALEGEENVIEVALINVTLSDNMIENNSFETGLDGWLSVGSGSKVQANGDGERSAEQHYDGEYSYKQKSNDGGTSGKNLFGQFALGDGVEKGKQYLLTFRRYGSGDTITLTLGLNDTLYESGSTLAANVVDESCGGLGNSDKSPVNCNLTGLPVNKWHQLCYTLTANEASKYAVVYARWCGGQYLDDFSLYEILDGGISYADVTVKYENENGEEIFTPVTLSARVGKDYDVSNYVVNNIIYNKNKYTYDGKADGELTGKVGADGVTVTLTYTAEAYDGIVLDLSFDDETAGFEGGLGKAVPSGQSELVDGKKGKALSLDGSGDNWLNAVTRDGEGSLLANMQEFTITYYSKVNKAETNWPFFAAMSSGAQSNGSEHYLGMLDKGTDLTLERYSCTGGRDSSNNVDAKAKTGEWKHIAVVAAKDRTEVYVDGVKAGETAAKNTLRDVLGDSPVLQIGKANWGDGEFYNGLIDEFKIYDRALTSDEIAVIGGGAPEVSLGWNGTDFTIDFLFGTGIVKVYKPDGTNFSAPVGEGQKGVSFVTADSNAKYQARGVIDEFVGEATGVVSVYGLVTEAIEKFAKDNPDTLITKLQLDKATDVLNNGGIYVTVKDGAKSLTPETARLMDLDPATGTITIKEEIFKAGLKFADIRGYATDEAPDRIETEGIAVSEDGRTATIAAIAAMAEDSVIYLENVEFVLDADPEESAADETVSGELDFVEEV